MKLLIFDIANNRIIKHHMLDNKIVKMADISLHYPLQFSTICYLKIIHHTRYQITEKRAIREAS